MLQRGLWIAFFFLMVTWEISAVTQELSKCKREKSELQEKLDTLKQESEHERNSIINLTAKYCACTKKNLHCIYAGRNLNMTRLSTGTYYANHSKVSWKVAHDFCALHGLHLVEIESRTEMAEVEKVQTESSYWTAGTDRGDPGQFRWKVNGQEVNPTLWYLSQPDSFGPGRVSCVNLLHERLFDDPCDHEYGFICELPRECK
ncbi:C-type lectin 37Da-like [Neocloeon triangulifer]|uniref:C-type lectin 37Da-like n=1 Tax=Neocloeon triangulifer TaxID=2078957 RepID=UPI00286EFC17|nr:C-type lectin 37Da-like [Neocloeon triangulifer]